MLVKTAITQEIPVLENGISVDMAPAWAMCILQWTHLHAWHPSIPTPSNTDKGLKGLYGYCKKISCGFVLARVVMTSKTFEGRSVQAPLLGVVWLGPAPFILRWRVWLLDHPFSVPHNLNRARDRLVQWNGSEKQQHQPSGNVTMTCWRLLWLIARKSCMSGMDYSTCSGNQTLYHMSAVQGAGPSQTILGVSVH